ncbi:MAG: ATP-binding protein [Sulfurimicrobium sp.]|nr:ATP-binding protein [Sulfurimicrobium sp.]MDP2963270.1 ATP-binding protein [Sulfurimicrobium sp.]MDP3689090.1 ATP-binding protein [Sulfurimicrobium sp.]MDZ7656821.1 ATP-binding protein [Sulfurimicrobium sp.]
MSTGPAPQNKDNPAAQHVFKVRRDYNTWVANETLEDYALRFTPRSYRKWSEMQVANTAFGAASFLVLEAVGATLLVNYGFLNAAWAIVVAGIIIFLAGIPVSRYAALHGLDMDLLTRGAGFGYLGSTVTSLIYASFTFIFFALEAAIMAYALELGFGIPPAWGYLICALVVIPLVTHGISTISRLQTLTLPVWLLMLLLPYLFVLIKEPQAFAGLLGHGGSENPAGGFDVHLFGAALAVALALITQMGEQVDYLRFMPERTTQNRKRWLAGVLIGGPGWVIPGVVKMLGGAFLAYLAIRHGISQEHAVDPNQMYLVAYGYVFSNPGWAVAATVVFVVVSQLKINVTNAYAGSLAWSNFFSRITHSHPGRVVWVVFNTLIALMLMELDLFQAMGRVLGLYSNVAVAWMMAVVADLVINKPLGLSPHGIEFRRAYLYDVNPVGIGAMGIASLLSVLAYVGLFGPEIQPFAIFIALIAALVCSPLIAWLTKGRYYIARQPVDLGAGNALAGATHACTLCGKDYEGEDMARCPAYQGNICSLCCTLDARCHDQCKPRARLVDQWTALLERLLPASARPYLEAGLGHYLLMMIGIVSLLGLFIGLLYYQEMLALKDGEAYLLPHLRDVFARTSAALLVVTGVIAWWVVLANRSRQVAQEESSRQTRLLLHEIDSHRRTDELLQKAKLAAEQANQAKSRYITAISHELRTPLNSILGYAQILDGDEAIPPNRRQAVSVIHRSGDHLLSLIESTLDIARIESGKLSLDVRALDFPEFVQQIVAMFEFQARNKGIDFSYQPQSELPAQVRADERRLRQILINIIGNAVKFTTRGGVVFRLKYQREMATFEIEDSGPGIATEELERIFEPFSRGRAAHVGATGGTGLGLTIAKMLTDVMGGELTVESTPGQGSRFRIRLFLPQLAAATQSGQGAARVRPIGYVGVRRRILIVDNEKTDRELLVSMLEPLGFQLAQANSGQECLDLIPRFRPHLIFMDLAMPGIDGWETIRRIHEGGMTDAEIAVISANAFEKGAENDVNLASENFITKPVRMDALLDWIGRHLDLEWVRAEAPPQEPAPASAPVRLNYPPEEYLQALEEQIDLGYVRGILNKLGEIERLDVAHSEFVEVMRQLARQFQFEAMKEILRKGQEQHDTD